MHILIGLGIAVALLYFWLIGWWFARILVFLLFGCGGFAGGAAIAGLFPSPSFAVATILGLIGVALMWPIASIPTYYWRYKARQLQAMVDQALISPKHPAIPDHQLEWQHYAARH